MFWRDQQKPKVALALSSKRDAAKETSNVASEGVASDFLMLRS